MHIIERLEKFDLSKFEANIKNYHQQVKWPKSPSSTLNFGYGNNPYFWADFDPPTSADGISQIVYPCWQVRNAVEWNNTATNDVFRLYNVLNPVYDENGNLIGGDLVWGKYNLSVQS